MRRDVWASVASHFRCCSQNRIAMTDDTDSAKYESRGIRRRGQPPCPVREHNAPVSSWCGAVLGGPKGRPLSCYLFSAASIQPGHVPLAARASSRSIGMPARRRRKD